MWMTYILAVQIASTLLLKCTCHGDHHQPNATPGDLLSMVIDLQMRTRVRTSRLPKGAVTQGHRRIVPMLVVIPIPERFQLKRGVYVSCIIRCLHKLSPLCYPARCGMVARSQRFMEAPLSEILSCTTQKTSYLTSKLKTHLYSIVYAHHAAHPTWLQEEGVRGEQRSCCSQPPCIDECWRWHVHRI
jgi:hypothetical protein